MPKEISITLTEGERTELHERACASVETPQRLDRLQAVRLADCGWPADIARHLRLARTAVVRQLEAYLAGGFDALDALPSARPRWPASDYAWGWDGGYDRPTERGVLRRAALANAGAGAGTICWAPPLWRELGLFPVEWAVPGEGGAGSDREPAPDFTAVIERLWRHLLADRGAREAFRRYEFTLPEHARAVEAYVDTLSGGALERFLTAAGVDWCDPPHWPTCAHAGCCLPWFDALADWRRPVRERVWQWAVDALRSRVRVQSGWPGPGVAAEAGRPWLTAPRRWPYPRPLPWEAGDAR